MCIRDSTITPTPLPPRRPTAVPIEITPTPMTTQTLAIPTAVPRMHIPADALTIVLLGSDQRTDWSYWNTDAIQYLVIYPDIPSVTMLSIPRDLYVFIPNYRMARINTADYYGELYNYDGGGLGLLNQTLLYNLGITADYYVKVTFDGLIGIVDALGGIEVPVNCRVEDYWPYPDEQGEYPWLVLEQGMVQMDGELALWYARTRKTTSVFARERRQQQVLEALWRRGKQINIIESAPALIEQCRELYNTDLTLGSLLSLAVTAAQIQPADVRRYNIGYQQVEFYLTEQGGNVYLPIWEEVEPVLQDVIARPAASRAAQGLIPVEVWNGTGRADWDRLAADRLAHYGYQPLVGHTTDAPHAQTSIIAFNTVTKGAGLELLQTLFRVPDERVYYADDPNTTARLRLILGQDYDPCQ